MNPFEKDWTQPDPNQVGTEQPKDDVGEAYISGPFISNEGNDSSQKAPSIYGLTNWPLPITHQSFNLDIKTLEICQKHKKEYLNNLQCELIAVAKGITRQKEEADEHLRNFLREYFKKETPDLNFSERVAFWSSRLRASNSLIIQTLYTKPPAPFTDWFYDAVRDYFESLPKEKPDECGVRK